MPIKTFKSDWTWRTSEQQDETLYMNVPNYQVALVYENEQREEMLRKSKRTEIITIYATSAAIFARSEKDATDFFTLCKKRNVRLIGIVDNFDWLSSHTVASAVAIWRKSRNNGAATVGARISADVRRKQSQASIDLIKGRWPLPSSEWRTADLLKEADLSLNTVKSVLGSRPIAQYNYQAAQKRKERRNAKN